MMAGGGGVGRAQGNGDLLLDWAIGDNTPISVGVVDTQCQSFSAGTLVQIDVIAVNAVDWAATDFVIEYPAPAVVTGPGPDSFSPPLRLTCPDTAHALTDAPGGAMLAAR